MAIFGPVGSEKWSQTKSLAWNQKTTWKNWKSRKCQGEIGKKVYRWFDNDEFKFYGGLTNFILELDILSLAAKDPMEVQSLTNIK